MASSRAKRPTRRPRRTPAQFRGCPRRRSGYMTSKSPPSVGTTPITKLDIPSPLIRNAPTIDQPTLEALRQLERKILWLSTWMIHNANHLRPSRDGLKVGGHQSSSASVSTLMTALYLDVMRPQDRVAV